MPHRFFDLLEAPFDPEPDPRFFWISQTHQEALAALEYGIERRDGFILLTGEPGFGKTMLIRRLGLGLRQPIALAVVPEEISLGPHELLQHVAREFGMNESGLSKSNFTIGVSRFLVECQKRGTHPVLVIDGAHHFEAPILEEMRLLSNLEADAEKLLTIVLSGDLPLSDQLQAPALRSLRQRISIEYELQPLESEEIRPYLEHRLRIVGGEIDAVFAPGVEQVFDDFALGAPRRINLLAQRALEDAAAHGERPVTPARLRESAAKLSAIPPTRHPHRRPDGAADYPDALRSTTAAADETFPSPAVTRSG